MFLEIIKHYPDGKYVLLKEYGLDCRLDYRLDKTRCEHSKVIKHLPHSVGYIYTKEAFSKEGKDDILDMVKNMKIAFEENVLIYYES